MDCKPKVWQCQLGWRRRLQRRWTHDAYVSTMRRQRLKVRVRLNDEGATMQQIYTRGPHHYYINITFLRGCESKISSRGMWLSTEAQPRLIIIFWGMIFRLASSQECYIYFIIPNIIPLFSNHGARIPKTTQCVSATNDWIIFHKRVVFVNSLNVQTGRDRRLNKSCHNHWWHQTL